MSDGNTWMDWRDRIKELDSGSFEVTKNEGDFLENLLENTPVYLSVLQVDWLNDMCRKYGVM